jgi:hypothetical protein
MTEQSKKADRSSRVMCESIASTVLDLFVDELLVEANLSDDRVLDAVRISELARDFKGENKDKYLRHIRKIAEDWLTDIERDHWKQVRKRPFERILVHRFSHLFPPTESLDDPGAVSRRALPGLLHAFELMAGAEFLGQCQDAGRTVFRTLKEERGGELSRNDFYGDQGANDLVDDLLVIVAWGFKDPGKRLKWLRDQINAKLSPPEDYAFEGDAIDNWTLAEEGLVEILRGLFLEFKNKLANADGARLIELRYGQKASKTIESLVGRLFDED